MRSFATALRWSIFKDPAANLVEYATVVTDLVSKCVEDRVCFPTGTTDKLWDPLPGEAQIQYSNSIQTNPRGTTYAEPLRLPRWNSGQSWSLETITQISINCGKACILLQATKAKVSWIASNNGTLPDELKTFYASFEQKAYVGTSPGLSASGLPVSTVNVADVSSAFLIVNLRNSTGPEGVCGCDLGICVDQPGEVSTDIHHN